MRRLLLVGAAAAGAAAVAFYVKVRPWWQSWGIDPGEASLALPGDELVPHPTFTDTRGITIDAPPSAVWPWLVQMGYGRGGWYSYDQLDMKGASATTIVPEWQELSVDDTVPMHPSGGFAVKHLEAERDLVLFIDESVVAGWRGDEDDRSMTPTAGLAMAGAMGSVSMPEHSAFSWAFALRPTPDGRTRLIERFRGSFEPETPGSRLGLPIMGFGTFVMLQRQMVGIQERAERLARERGIPAIAAEVGPKPDVEGAPIVEASPA